MTAIASFIVHPRLSHSPLPSSLLPRPGPIAPLFVAPPRSLASGFPIFTSRSSGRRLLHCVSNPGVTLPDPGSGQGGGQAGGGGGGSGRGGGDSGDRNEGASGGDSEGKKIGGGMSMSQKITLGYATLVGVGGVMGYLKSGSQKSLAAGSLSALLLYFVYTQLPVRPAFASSLGLGLSAALLVVMGSRFRKSGKIFPAGVVSLVSLVMVGGYFHGVLRSLHA